MLFIALQKRRKRRKKERKKHIMQTWCLCIWFGCLTLWRITIRTAHCNLSYITFSFYCSIILFKLSILHLDLVGHLNLHGWIMQPLNFPHFFWGYSKACDDTICFVVLAHQFIVCPESTEPFQPHMPTPPPSPPFHAQVKLQFRGRTYHASSAHPALPCCQETEWNSW